jgi:hypothetical protein
VLAPPNHNATLIEGTVVRTDGEPLADVEVYLATPDNPFNLYTHKQQPRRLEITEPDGKFSFSRPPDDRWKIVALTPDAVAEVAPEDLAASPLIVLRPWGRIEGTLYAATKPLAGQTVNVEESGWPGDPLRWCVTRRTSVKTDKDGHFVLPRVPPGMPVLSHEKAAPWMPTSKWDCVRVAPGQSVVVNLGAVGRPVTGKLVLPPGFENKLPFETGSSRVHASVFVQRIDVPDIPLPPEWDTMTTREQARARARWEATDAGLAYRKVYFCDNASTVAGDGTFRFDVLRPGRYDLYVDCTEPAVGLTQRPGDRTTVHEPFAGTRVPLTVPEMPSGAQATETPLDLGDIRLRPAPRVVPGQPAPPFNFTDVDGRPVTVDQFRGKYLLLHVRWSSFPQDEFVGHKIAYDAFGHDPRFTVLTVHANARPAAVRRIIREQGLAWPQAIGSSVGPDGIGSVYVRGTASDYLIGPDGIVLAKIFRADASDELKTTVAKVLGQKK